MAKKPTLTELIEKHLATMDVVTCSSVAEAVAPEHGFAPSLMAVSRILGTQAGWVKVDRAAKVTFRRLEAEELEQ